MIILKYNGCAHQPADYLSSMAMMGSWQKTVQNLSKNYLPDFCSRNANGTLSLSKPAAVCGVDVFLYAIDSWYEV